ncbi:lipoprotein [Citrobacter sp. JGM124]|uniref:LPS translocon maturation chaperone LptM n=1 Tax=Citrobacter sp. JGM124 TaxID=2799789 RepID=UPI001BA56D4C|nr:lipoprotein [Citrobacter sp. JGM124]MBS0849924.1 lipoprotein [Citrobacter sp. JGM124]
MKKIFCALVVVTTLTALTGCGLKGPLYFPPTDKEQTPTTKSVPKEDSIQTAPVRNNRGTGDGPTQVVY